MAKTEEDFILGALDNLSADQMDRFKHKQSSLHEIGYGLIEKESNAALTKMIINKFTKKHAIARTAEVLRAIELHDQAGGLEEANARILPVLVPPSPPEAVSAGTSSVKTPAQTMVSSAVGQGASSAAGTGDTGGRASDSSFTPTEELAECEQEKICSLHRKPLEVYCRSDEQCICVLCAMDEHKGHDTVSAAAERPEKQHSAQTAVEDSESILTELMGSFERMGSEVTELIRDQEKAEVSRVERHIERLEQEIAELRGRDAEMEQLSHTEDHINFLQRYQSVCAPPGPGDIPSITVNPHASFEAVRKPVSELKKQLEEFCKGGLVKISQTVKEVHLLEPRTREQFLQYSCRLTLDPNTAYKLLRLSEGNREMTCVEQDQSYPKHPERFDYWDQVLCREGLSGRCYWEAEWSGWVSIAVSYKEISRKGRGDDCALGCNDKSWSLICSSSSCSFSHNDKDTDLLAPPSSRIGVYLDHGAGTLSFYSVSDTMTLLYRVQTTFTQPLHPGFRVYGSDCSVKL